MKLVLFVALAAAAFAQVPAHSALGAVTVDVADISLTVPYGAPEARAAISACSVTPVTFLTFSVDYQDAPVPFYVQSFSIVKTDSGYCTSIVAPADRSRIISIMVQQTSSVQIAGAAAGGGAAAAQRVGKDRPQK